MRRTARCYKAVTPPIALLAYNVLELRFDLFAPEKRPIMRSMRLQSAAALVGLISLCSTCLVALGDPTVEGRVSQVTLYRGQAQVTRTVPVEGKAGSLEIIVSKLPEQVVPDSLFAEGGDAVEIRAVRFRTRAVGDQPREEVRKLDRE